MSARRTPAPRTDGAIRRQQFLDAGLRLVGTGRHFETLTTGDIAEEVGVSKSLFFRHWPTLAAYNRALMSEAVATGDAWALAQGLSTQNPIAQSAPIPLRKQALARLIAA